MIASLRAWDPDSSSFHLQFRTTLKSDLQSSNIKKVHHPDELKYLKSGQHLSQSQRRIRYQNLIRMTDTIYWTLIK